MKISKEEFLKLAKEQGLEESDFEDGEIELLIEEAEGND